MPKISALDKVLTQAVEDHQAGRHESARQGYLNVLQSAPNHPEALSFLAALFLENGLAAEAVELALQALRIAPDFIGARINLANAYQALQEFTAAAEQYEKALSLGGLQSEIGISYGNTLLHAKRPEDAEAQYRAALEDNGGGESARAQLNAGLASALMEQGRLAEAKPHFQAAIEAEPNIAGFRITYGKLLQEIDLLDDALGQYEQAWKLESTNPLAYETFAYSLIEKFEATGDDATRSRLVQLAESPPPRTPSSFLARRLIADSLEPGAPEIKKVRHLEKSGRFASRDLGGVELFDMGSATVCNIAWYVIKDGEVFPDIPVHLPNEMPWAAVTFCPTQRAIVNENLPKATVDGPVYLLGGCTNYYHWLVDHLPTLRALEETTDCRILVNADLTSFQRDSLAAAGIGAERLIPS